MSSHGQHKAPRRSRRPTGRTSRTSGSSARSVRTDAGASQQRADDVQTVSTVRAIDRTVAQETQARIRKVNVKIPAVGRMYIQCFDPAEYDWS